MSNLEKYSYVLLWDVTDHSTIETKLNAFRKATEWSGFPEDPINPDPIHIDLKKIQGEIVKPVVPLGGRRTKRGGPPGYVSLSNYNNLP